MKAGTFKPRVEAFGLASGVVRYEPNPGLDSLVPAALKARVKAAADSIAAGTLLPRAAAGVDAGSRPGQGFGFTTGTAGSRASRVASSGPLWRSVPRGKQPR